MKKNFGKFPIESKLSLLLSVLGFFCIAFLQVLGVIVGFFMTLVALYLGYTRWSKNKSDEMAHIAIFFSIFSIILLFSIGLMYFIVNGF